MSQQQQQAAAGRIERTPPTQRQAGVVGRQFPTRNYLEPDVRSSMIDVLNRALADATDLRTQAKFAHWNVKGMQFYALHLLFDDLAEVLAGHEDLLAERITALGGQAMGTARMAATNSRIEELPASSVTGQEYVQHLADRLAAHDAFLGDAMSRASEQGDLDTADLLNEVSREVSKYRWFLEAHLQAGPAARPPGNTPTL